MRTILVAMTMLGLGCAGMDHHSMIVPTQRNEDAARMDRQWQDQQVLIQQQTQQQNDQWRSHH